MQYCNMAILVLQSCENYLVKHYAFTCRPFLQTDLPRQKMYLCKIKCTLFLMFSLNIFYIYIVLKCLVVCGGPGVLFVCLFGFVLFRKARKK